MTFLEITTLAIVSLVTIGGCSTSTHDGTDKPTGELRSLTFDLDHPPPISDLPVTADSGYTGRPGERSWAADVGKRTFQVTLKRRDGPEIVDDWSSGNADDLLSPNDPPTVNHFLLSSLLPPAEARRRVEAFFDAFGGRDRARALSYIDRSLAKAKNGTLDPTSNSSFRAPRLPNGAYPEIEISPVTDPIDFGIDWTFDWDAEGSTSPTTTADRG